ncbi:MAG: hypothetical protein HY899_07340 [Deltaproteobacteria bacterium]|nr:hypothetical protein [Deltaproteobacteria bacterium]
MIMRGPGCSEVAPHKGGTLLLRLAFLLAFVVASWGYYFRLDRYPPHLDFDSATLGIFVNNLTFHGKIDYFFDESPSQQDRYRMFWGAYFLAPAIALSGVQRLADIPPSGVGMLLKAVTLLCGLSGCLCAAAISRRTRGFGLTEALFVVGFASTLPPLLLYLRTAVPHFLFSFLAFWFSLYLLVRFLESRTFFWSVALATVLAIYALVPYVPLMVLPLAALWLCCRRHLLRTVLTTRASYVAVLLSVGLALGVQYAVAVQYGGSWEVWRSKASHFLASRSQHAVSTQDLNPAVVIKKLEFLIHQHFWFQRDDLGDPSRDDSVWTLPQPHLVWLLLLPLLGVGIWTTIRTRDPAGDVFLAVLTCSYLVALTVSSPEGRYLITAVPCYAYFLCVGVERVVRGSVVRVLGLAAILVLSAVNSFVLVQGEYERSMLLAWKPMAGMPQTLELIQNQYGKTLGTTQTLYLSWPGLTYPSWLYLQMLGNMQVMTFEPSEAGSALESGARAFAVADAANDGARKAWAQNGFQQVARVRDDATGRELFLLAQQTAQ